jgi:hypothetical protein
MRAILSLAEEGTEPCPAWERAVGASDSLTSGAACGVFYSFYIRVDEPFAEAMEAADDGLSVRV